MAFDEALFRILVFDRLNTMLSNNGFFVLVKQGSTFQSGTTTYDVLSPWRRRLPFLKFNQDIQTIVNTLGISNEISTIEQYQNSIKHEIEDQVPNHFHYEQNGAEKDVEQAAVVIKTKMENMTDEKKKQIESQLTTSPEKASDLEHLYNIVFRSTDKKLLMCGDENTSDMGIIMTKFFGDEDLIQIIKVPHHGTKSHYYPFCTYQPEIGLISNANTSRGGRPYCFYQRDFLCIYDTYGNMKYIHQNTCRFAKAYRPGMNLTQFSVLSFPF